MDKIDENAAKGIVLKMLKLKTLDCKLLLEKIANVLSFSLIHANEKGFRYWHLASMNCHNKVVFYTTNSTRTRFVSLQSMLDHIMMAQQFWYDAFCNGQIKLMPMRNPFFNCKSIEEVKILLDMYV